MAPHAQTAGATVWGQGVDASQAEQMEALAGATLQRFGAPHLVFSNAGACSAGLIWEATAAGKGSADEVAERIFAALCRGHFSIYSHPQAMASVQRRMADILRARKVVGA